MTETLLVVECQEGEAGQARVAFRAIVRRAMLGGRYYRGYQGEVPKIHPTYPKKELLNGVPLEEPWLHIVPLISVMIQ